MNTILSRFVLAALAATGIASAVEVATTPVGYVTQELSQGFNLFSVSMHGATILSTTGVSVSLGDGTTLTKAGAFSALENGKYYILEITGGVLDGIVQEFNLSTDNSITLVGDLMALSSSDTITIRHAPTLETVFGTVNSVLKRSNGSTGADLVWIPRGDGTYNRYFLNNSNIWRNADGGTAPNVPIIYLDGLFVERKESTPVQLVVAGELKTKGTALVVNEGFNLIGTFAPIGRTLQNFGIDTSIKRSNGATGADLVWVPIVGTSNYKRYFLNNSGVWRDADGGLAPVDLPLPSSVFIDRRAGAGSVTIKTKIPTSWGF